MMTLAEVELMARRDVAAGWPALMKLVDDALESNDESRVRAALAALQAWGGAR